MSILLERKDLERVHYDGILGRYLDALSMRNYLVESIIPHLGSMEKWESKEYLNSIDSNISELKENAEILINVDYFKPLLIKYNISVEDISESVKKL